MTSAAIRTRSSDLVHPIPLTAVVLLIVNDHVWKGGRGLPAWVTGKISDFAGLFFFPVLLTVLVEHAWRCRGGTASRRRIAWSCVLLTFAVFTALKSVPAIAAIASTVIGPIVCDPTDLVALSALVFSLHYLLRELPATRRPPPRWVQAMTVLFAATASLATSPVRVVRGYPAWVVAGPAQRDVGCAQVEAWISKSGKQGLGVTLRFTSATETSCYVQIASARVVLEGATIASLTALPTAVAPPPTAYVYLPFGFDNEAAWNDRKNVAKLDLALTPAGGPEITWEIPLEQRLTAHHVSTTPEPGGTRR